MHCILRICMVFSKFIYPQSMICAMPSVINIANFPSYTYTLSLFMVLHF